MSINFSKRLAEYMESKKISQYKLWKITGVSQSMISDILSGTKSPTLDTIHRLLAGLEISDSEFFSGKSIESVKSTAPKTDDISLEDLELLRKLKKLPSDKREIVDAVIKVSEAAKDESSAAVGK